MDAPNSEALADTLERQAALQREADHRVKNTLQLISSIVMLQGRRAADEGARQALKSLLQRVQAVSVTHRHVVCEGDHEVVELAALLRELTADLAASAGREGIAVALDLEPTRAPAKHGAPVALLFSEALVNALRHAFPDGQAGRVAVSLHASGDGYVLTVADNGVGARDAPKGFGSTVIQLLAQQLRARLSTEATQPGWKLSVSVPMDTPRPPQA